MNTSVNKTAIATSAQQVAALVAALDMVAADKSITLVADTHGDKMVTKVLKALPPPAVAHLLTEVATKPTSLIGDLIAPATFAVAFEQLPKKWGRNDEATAIRDVEALITGIVMQLDDDYKYIRAKELYKALNKEHNGVILAWWLMKYTSDVVYFASNGKWLRNLDDFAFKEQPRTTMSGVLDHSLLPAVSIDDEGEEIDPPEMVIPNEAEFVVDDDEDSKFIYCICPDEIRTCVEKMPRELLEKVVKHLNAWAPQKLSSSEVFITLLPEIPIQNTTAQSAL